jgi:hypothetical protein
MPTKKKLDPVAPVPAKVPKKARGHKPVAESMPVLTKPKTLFQLGMELGTLQRTFAGAAKANALHTYFQPPLGLIPTKLPNILSFQTPVWKHFAGAQRIFNRLDQFQPIVEFFRFPTEAELEARYEKRKRAALDLAKRGWFVPLGMTLGELKTLFKKMAEGKEEEAEGLIEKHLEANLTAIENELVKQSPDLAAMLKEAFKLHDEGKYFGSVALFLCLSDGIGQRIFQVSPVSSGEKSLKQIKKLIEPHRNKDFLIGWCWEVIGEVLPVNDRTANLDDYVDPLNRHAVVHVVRSDHGTKRHSLKAVSWVNHVSQFGDLLLARAATTAASAS